MVGCSKRVRVGDPHAEVCCQIFAGGVVEKEVDVSLIVPGEDSGPGLLVSRDGRERFHALKHFRSKASKRGGGQGIERRERGGGLIRRGGRRGEAGMGDGRGTGGATQL